MKEIIYINEKIKYIGYLSEYFGFHKNYHMYSTSKETILLDLSFFETLRFELNISFENY